MEAPHASLTALGGGAGAKGEGTDLGVGRAAADLAKLQEPQAALRWLPEMQAAR